MAQQFSTLAADLNCAARFYQGQLRHSPRAIAYLKKRGISGGSAVRYGLGFAPAGAQTLRATFEDYEAQSLVDCGLVVMNEQGRRYDRFRDRIMFPIVDAAGVVIGFGGRVIDAQAPKYLNSPETPLFHKGNVLFGLPQAASVIKNTDTVYVVEGYLDVISLAQHGIPNVVATLGTATTSTHIATLLSLAKHIVFCFDGDDAGRRAANHALDICLASINDATTISFLFLPNGHDPDSFIRANGAEAFFALAAAAASLEAVFLAEVMTGVSLEYAEGRAKLIYNATPGLQQLQATALLRRLLDTIASYSACTVEELVSLCGLDWANVPE